MRRWSSNQQKLTIENQGMLTGGTPRDRDAIGKKCAISALSGALRGLGGSRRKFLSGETSIPVNRFASNDVRIARRPIMPQGRLVTAFGMALTKRPFHRKIISMARITVENCLQNIPHPPPPLLCAATRSTHL